MHAAGRLENERVKRQITVFNGLGGSHQVEYATYESLLNQGIIDGGASIPNGICHYLTPWGETVAAELLRRKPGRKETAIPPYEHGILTLRRDPGAGIFEWSGEWAGLIHNLGANGLPDILDLLGRQGWEVINAIGADQITQVLIRRPGKKEETL